jgi:hypothetical protein
MSNILISKEVKVQRKGIGRFEGRLFADEGRLYLVVEADETTGRARVSCCIDGERQVLDMPLTEVSRHLSSGSNLILDNINGPQSASRVLEKEGAWFFSTREGLKGPFSDKDRAEKALGKYIVAAQSTAAAS